MERKETPGDECTPDGINVRAGADGLPKRRALVPGSECTPNRRAVRFHESIRKFYGSCLFCNQDRYETLQCHRVIPGEKGGKYHRANVVVLCASCHSLVTAGLIRTVAIHRGSTSQFVLHYFDENGNEHYRPMRARRPT